MKVSVRARVRIEREYYRYGFWNIETSEHRGATIVRKRLDGKSRRSSLQADHLTLKFHIKNTSILFATMANRGATEHKEENYELKM